MDICYYNSQIKEELEGAKDYIQRAINCKKAHPKWAESFAKMSDMELEHAETLLNMFKEECEAVESEDPIYNQVKESITDMYTEFASRVEFMHSMYKEM